MIHRDLKPGNILVTSAGEVKVVDFGLAKLVRGSSDDATACLTRTGMRLMTPEYASPEQVRGDSVDVATDVYSLGVVLYELLTGHRPYRMRARLIHEVVRVICEEEPIRPSGVISEVEERPGDEGPIPVTPQSVSRTRQTTAAELRRELSGEIDNILLKALRKEPQQRYNSVKDFSNDTQRHLDGLPVLAQGQGLAYRVGKFLRRYRVWVAAIAFAAVGIGTGAVRISIPALNVIVVTLQFLLFIYLFARLKYGPELAKRRLFYLASVAFVCALIFLSWDTLRRGRDLPNAGELIGLLWVPAGLICAFRLARLDLRRSRSRAVPGWVRGMALLFLCLFWLAFFASSVRMYRRLEGSPRVLLLVSVCMAVVMTQLMLQWRRIEIRERGVVTRRGLLRWRRVGSYTWEHAGTGLALLTLHMRSSLPLFRRRRILIDADRRPEADAMLSKQFAEWPGHSEQL